MKTDFLRRATEEMKARHLRSDEVSRIGASIWIRVVAPEYKAAPLTATWSSRRRGNLRLWGIVLLAGAAFASVIVLKSEHPRNPLAKLHRPAKPPAPVASPAAPAAAVQLASAPLPKQTVPAMLPPAASQPAALPQVPTAGLAPVSPLAPALALSLALTPQAEGLARKAPTSADIFAEAEAATRNLPPTWQPETYLAMALTEGRVLNNRPVGLVAAAFEAARALPPRLDGTTDAPTAALKVQLELDAVQTLLGDTHGGLALLGNDSGWTNFGRALALTRSADVPREPLYSALLASPVNEACTLGIESTSGRGGAVHQVGTRMGPSLGPAGSARGSDPCAPFLGKVSHPGQAPPGYNAAALADECWNSERAYPYAGAIQALEFLPHADALALIEEGLPHVGDDVELGAPAFLNRAHTVAPEIDGQLVPVAINALTRAGGDLTPESSDPRARDHQISLTIIGRNLITLLRMLDPSRAVELAARYPAFSAAVANRFAADAPLPGRGALARPIRPAVQLADVMAMPEDTSAARAGKVQSLLSLARVWPQAHPGEADEPLALAAHLAGDPAMDEAVEIDPRTEVAQLFLRDGDSTTARVWIEQSLDALDAQAEVLDSAFRAAAPLDRLRLTPPRLNYGPINLPVQVFRLLLPEGSDTALSYTIAGEIDLKMALQRARASPAWLGKPQMLMGVAEAAHAVEVGGGRVR